MDRTSTTPLIDRGPMVTVAVLGFETFALGVYRLAFARDKSVVLVRLARDVESLDHSCWIPVGWEHTGTEQVNSNITLLGFGVVSEPWADSALEMALRIFGGPISDVDRLLELVEKLVQRFVATATTESETNELHLLMGSLGVKRFDDFR